MARRHCHLTVGIAGTYTLEATDGGDGFAISVPFSVGNSPRDALIQALKDFEGAVAAYQTACINVFAAADVPLAELIHTNNQGLFSDLLSDIANDRAQDWVEDHRFGQPHRAGCRVSSVGDRHAHHMEYVGDFVHCRLAVRCDW